MSINLKSDRILATLCWPASFLTRQLKNGPTPVFPEHLYPAGGSYFAARIVWSPPTVGPSAKLPPDEALPEPPPAEVVRMRLVGGSGPRLVPINPSAVPKALPNRAGVMIAPSGRLRGLVRTRRKPLRPAAVNIS
jgi:hypothetical protein